VSEDKRLFQDVAPVLPVDDLAEAVDFYRERLGFDDVFTWGEPAYFAIVKRGAGVRIHLSEREDTREKIQPRSVYVFVADVDAVYREYHSRGLEMFSPPTDYEYGMREFEVRDNSGHFLIFGQGI
jgi:predicted enzyme related to lactoylglutathione lyase